MHSFTLTRHGCQRARERVGWTASTAMRMLDRIFFTGLDEFSAPRPMQRFLQAKAAKTPGAIARIFGEQLFIFTPIGLEAYALVTVYPLPPDLRRVVRGQKRFPRLEESGPPEAPEPGL